MKSICCGHRALGERTQGFQTHFLTVDSLGTLMALTCDTRWHGSVLSPGGPQAGRTHQCSVWSWIHTHWVHRGDGALELTNRPGPRPDLSRDLPGLVFPSLKIGTALQNCPGQLENRADDTSKMFPLGKHLLLIGYLLSLPSVPTSCFFLGK